MTDTLNSTLRVVDIDSGLTTTVAGDPGIEGVSDGVGPQAHFRKPTAVARVGTNIVYVADTGNHVIRRVDIGTASVSTIAGTAGVSGTQNGTGPAARFNSPQGLAAVGQLLYVADSGNSSVRLINLATGAVSDVAGVPGTAGYLNGPKTNALFNHPSGLAYDSHRRQLYVADTGNHLVRSVAINASPDTVISVAGTPGVSGYADGAPLGSQFGSPSGLLYAANGLFVTDSATYMVRRIDLVENVVSTLAGAAWERGSEDGPGGAARFRAPGGMALSRGHLFVADTGNHVIRNLDIATEWLSSRSAGEPLVPPDEAGAQSVRAVVTVKTLAGKASQPGAADGWAPRFEIGSVKHVLCDGRTLYTDGNGVNAIDLLTGHVDTILGTSTPAPMARVGSWLYIARGVEYTLDTVEVTTRARSITTFDNQILNDITSRDGALYLSVTDDGEAPGAPPTVMKLTVDSQGQVAGASGPVTFGAGDFGAWRDVSGDRFLYRADWLRHVITRRSAATGITTVVAGSTNSSGNGDGAAGDARFNAPEGVCLNGTDLYVADTGNRRVRKLDLQTNVVTTLALNLRGAYVAGSIADGQACTTNSSCQSGVCDAQLCRPIGCRDGKMVFGPETDVDCGLSCGPCKRTDDCRTAADCSHGDPCLFGVCSAPAYCSNGVLDDGLEAAVDCGGKCKPCSIGGACYGDHDLCMSRSCQGTCSAPAACFDGIRNWNEAGVDCGGWCQPCL